MTWQAYVDNNLVGAGFAHACLIGHDGSVWATSTGFSLQGTEGKAIAALFAKDGGAFATGIIVGGKKHMAIKSDTRSAYGKLGAGGVVCVKTATGIIVAVYDDKLQPGAAANIAEKLADYLIENSC
ncbi:hypothetical protein RB653_000351 [Dictyostelium firmibasis]|uniref:Profilin n=1 Tax=Dictyostelium firmibasis TaxID=79012 RepID=A0AAN7U6W7_9MYCE